MKTKKEISELVTQSKKDYENGKLTQKELIAKQFEFYDMYDKVKNTLTFKEKAFLKQSKLVMSNMAKVLGIKRKK